MSLESQNRWANLELDLDRPAPSPEPTPAPPVEVSAPLPLAEILGEHGIPMSEQARRIYGYLRSEGCAGLLPTSSQTIFYTNREKIAAACAKLEAVKNPHPTVSETVAALHGILVRARTAPPELVEAPAPEPAPPPVKTALTSTGYIAVSEASASTGTMVFWSLSGRIRTEELKAEWAAQGLDPAWLPELPSTEKALTAAAKSAAKKTLKVYAHPTGGWDVVEENTLAEHVVGEAWPANIKLRVYLEGDTLKFEHPPLGEQTELENEIRREYESQLVALSTNIVSSWLVKTLVKLNAVCLKNNGGTYFVPAGTGVETLSKLAEALGKSSTHKIYEVPAIKTTKTITAIFDAVQGAAERQITEIENEITAGDLGKRAAANRINECDALGERIASYEKLLGQKLGDVAERLKTLKGKLALVTHRFNLLEVD